jgi:hypothetical protein
MHRRILLVSVSAALLISSCSPPIPRPGSLQPFSSACDKSNEGQWIAVEGYLRLPDAFTDSTSIELHLYADPRFDGTPIGVILSFGSGPDQAEKISSSFRDDDLKVHLADGALVPFRTRLRVSGRMAYPITAQPISCLLENPYLESAK